MCKTYVQKIMKKKIMKFSEKLQLMLKIKNRANKFFLKTWNGNMNYHNSMSTIEALEKEIELCSKLRQ